MDFEALIRNDAYQVFLFTGRATAPYVFARHPWFVVNRMGTVSRWEIFWRPAYQHLLRWGHLHKDFYPPTQGIEMFFLSQKYFWGPGTLHGSIEGGKGSLADRMSRFIERSPECYPFGMTYALRGPNSNTYAQWIVNHFPDSNLHLPWNTFGASCAPRVYSGIVQRGRRRGHVLGYPTVNIPFADKDTSGVFAARVYVGDEAPYMATAFADLSRDVLEAHLLDFSDDLYGLEVKVELHKKIRDYRLFTNDDEAKEMIAEDIAKAREYLKN